MSGKSFNVVISLKQPFTVPSAEADRLNGVPGVLIHGRLDLSVPLLTAWELAQAWQDAELVVIEDSGHTDSPRHRDRRP